MLAVGVPACAYEREIKVFLAVGKIMAFQAFEDIMYPADVRKQSRYSHDGTHFFGNTVSEFQPRENERRQRSAYNAVDKNDRYFRRRQKGAETRDNGSENAAVIST